MSLSESKKIVKKLNIKSSKDWDLFTKSKKFEPLKEKGVTHNPYIYNNDPEWKGLPDYLGYKKITNKNKYVSYEEAEKYVRGFNFIRAADYLVYYSKNLFSIDLPKYPEHHYARYGGKWKNWYEFLGKKK